MNTFVVPSERYQPSASDPLTLGQTQGYGLAEDAQRDLFAFFAAAGEGAPALAPGVGLEVGEAAPSREDGGGHDSDVNQPCEPATRSPLDALDEVAGADLRRLELSLNWLQSEAEACRLPRAVQLPPIEGLPAVAGVIDRSPLQRTLQRAAPMPAWLTAPEAAPSFSLTRPGRGAWRGVVRFLSACAVAAPTAYLFAVATTPSHRILDDLADLAPQILRLAPLPWVTASTARTGAGLAGPVASVKEDGSPPVGAAPLLTPPPAAAAVHAGVDAAAENPRDQTAIEPHAAETAAAGPSIAPEKAAAAHGEVEDAASHAVHDAVVEAPSAPRVVAAPSSEQGPADDGRAPDLTTGVGADPAKPSRSSDAAPARATPAPRQITLWIDQGRQFFDAGDLVAARILFQRAANAGDSAAAVAMGATYDPVILAGRGFRGVVSDREKARSWYERAREMGSPEGPRRIEMLANR